MASQSYYWESDKKAAKEFSKLDRAVQRRIVRWLDDHIEGYDNSRAWGRALEGKLGTLWRYRVGNYRVIADIRDGKLLVLVVKTGKRGQVYER
ncbi:type II toxin-antitoxin system RelE family toxin [Lacticaseibacillus chiayiensis]|uniref:type II toxin-antitoxin system RelE family toxin n=1 Tax=Lacticaseibacillus chiayiensis TaxID=2100821 RepID=UPI0010131F8E|nr:type II toxin-antitoxin system RelE/ParE family toxin [Lacticaseibacillus chiayiensis]RXT57807.1 type II toxin-antitoxin system mRNA interferase toxin, RelE/StbE family [Lacticaseibacillus chiayiensis]